MNTIKEFIRTNPEACAILLRKKFGITLAKAIEYMKNHYKEQNDTES